MQLNDVRDHWALVTGASEGIGKGFCQQLAAAGVHLVLVARRQEMLREVAATLEENHGIQTRVVATDLSAAAASAELKQRVQAEGIRVRLLVNNAGSGRWGRFEAAPLACYETMIALNTTAMVSLCYQFLPDLSSFPSSAVINVGSPAALQPVPYMAVYAATKAFVHSFSQALYGEWGQRGVLVQTLIPGPTATGFDEKAQAYESVIQKRDSPAQVVEIALAHLSKNTPLAVAAKNTLVQRLFANLAPSKLVIRQVGRMFTPPE